MKTRSLVLAWGPQGAAFSRAVHTETILRDLARLGPANLLPYVLFLPFGLFVSFMFALIVFVVGHTLKARPGGMRVLLFIVLHVLGPHILTSLNLGHTF